uniref:Uncharacterized protein n=2 Tax=Chrysotila carterae TaxID=13221 RepID=A0A7S4BGT2_CHRCT
MQAAARQGASNWFILCVLFTQCTVSVGKLLPAAACMKRPLQLRIIGFGEAYEQHPGVFLAKDQSQPRMLPVPLSRRLLATLEQADDPRKLTAAELFLDARLLAERDCGNLIESLPWEDSPSGILARRDAYARLVGRGDGLTDGFFSAYHLLLDIAQRKCGVQVEHVLLEETDLFGSLRLGGAVVVARQSDAGLSERVCECTVEEALGIALALDRQVWVEEEVVRAAETPVQFTLQGGKMRLQLRPRTEVDAGSPRPAPDAAEPGAKAVLPWELTSAAELLSMSREDKARSALAAGLQLPRARVATDEALTALLSPLLDEAVRRQLGVRAAAAEGRFGEAASIERAATRRGRMMQEMQRAVDMGNFVSAASIAQDLRVENNRRMDVTLDEGEYDAMLDQDDWCAACP